MKLATLPSATRDGRLVKVSGDNRSCSDASHIASTLQDAIERWDEVEAALAKLPVGAEPFDPERALAPLPRAWQWLDGSAFLSHAFLMQKVFGMDPVSMDRPLMYQGISDRFIPPCADVVLPSEDDWIDFEGEIGVIVDEVPMAVSPALALSHIKLLVLINDWSLRKLAPVEMKTGFGWVQAKPPCSMGPIAITPDELGAAWTEGRVDLPLRVQWNERPFGHAEAGRMAFGFHELVAHAARTRALCAGTVIGSGTVSNDDFRAVGSSCIAERRGIEIMDGGAPVTEFMRFGDRIRMEMALPDGRDLFGAIDQSIVQQ